MAEKALAKLLQGTHLSSHDELLTAANAALKANKADRTAQRTRVVALLNLERFQDAVRVFEEAGDSLKSEAAVEYIYGLYKAGDLHKAEEAASNQEQRSRGIQHVSAQIAYNLEKYDQAAKLYDELSQPSAATKSEESDLRINRGATDAQLEWKGLGDHVSKERKQPKRGDLEAFESCFNAACGSVARGEFAQSEVLLRRAKDLCQASEDLSDEAKKTEILPILVQQAYVLARLGKDEEAKKLLESLDIQESSDSSIGRATKVNLLACAGTPSNPYLVHQNFHSAIGSPKADPPSGYQASILRQDEYVLDLLALKYAGVARSTNDALKSSDSPSTSSSLNSLSVLNAAANSRNAVGKEGLKAILPLLEKRPNDVGLILTIVQLYMLTNNHGSAITLMEKFLAHLENSSSPSDADVRYAPGLVGTLVSLHSLKGSKTQIRTELAKATKYWLSKAKDDKNSTLPLSLLKAAGLTLLESTDPNDMAAASAIFTDLHAYHSSDKAVNAGLVASLSLTAPEKLDQSILDSLTPSTRLVAGIDAAALEEAGIARPPTAPAQDSKKRRAETHDAARKPKKIKASRMPKDFDPNKKVDPERWLPLRDRSTYKPKGRKGKARQAGLTQGGVVDDEKAKVPAEQQQVLQQKQAPGGPQAKNKKKKGKGGKW